MKPLRVFIIQPFQQPHSELFRKLVTDVCHTLEQGNAFDAFHAIGEPSSEPRLQDRINEHIQKADICVVDLGNQRNENALLETGAAYALRIPVIPFSDKELPSDIRGNVWLKYDPSRLSEQPEQEAFKKLLAGKPKDSRNQLGAIRTERYLAAAFGDRGAVDFYSLIRRCERRLDVLTTNLNYIVNEELQCEDDGEPQTFLQLLESGLASKPARFEVRILALDPDSNYTNERALSLHRNRQVFREQMREDLERVKEYIESPKCTVAAGVHIYEDYPLQMTFFFDDTVVSSVVAGSRSSRYCVTYMHSLKESGAQETYERHFDQLWGKSNSYASSIQMKKHNQVSARQCL